MDERQPVPWKWLGLGIIVTLVGIAIAAVILSSFLLREPLPTAVEGVEIIRLTAPPGSVATMTPALPTATNVPTLTPPPTPDLSIAPEAITVGYFAVVANTDNVGVSLRGGPSTDYVLSHSIVYEVSCDRCHFAENPWELTVLTADGEIPEPEEGDG